MPSLSSLLDVHDHTTYYPPFEELTKITYGEPKVGKTKYADGAPDAMFLATEPGHDFCKSLVRRVFTWAPDAKTGPNPDRLDFQTIVRALYAAKKEGKLKHRITNVDIVDNLYSMCLNHVCQRKGIDYPPENDFGKTWKEIREEWAKWLTALLDVVSVHFITHTTTDKVDIIGQNGIRKEIERRIPTFKGNKAAQFLDGVVNVMGFAHFGPSGERQIIFRGDQTLATGDRTGIFEAMGPLPLDWAKVSAAYAAECKKRNITIRSKWA